MPDERTDRLRLASRIFFTAVPFLCVFAFFAIIVRSIVRSHGWMPLLEFLAAIVFGVALVFLTVIGYWRLLVSWQFGRIRRGWGCGKIRKEEDIRRRLRADADADASLSSNVSRAKRAEELCVEYEGRAKLHERVVKNIGGWDSRRFLWGWLSGFYFRARYGEHFCRWVWHFFGFAKLLSTPGMNF